MYSDRKIPPPFSPEKEEKREKSRETKKEGQGLSPSRSKKQSVPQRQDTTVLFFFLLLCLVTK